METGKFSDNLGITENGLVSGVDRVIKSSNKTKRSDFDEVADFVKMTTSSTWNAR